MSHARPVLGALTAAVLLAAGCGSSSGKGDPAAATAAAKPAVVATAAAGATQTGPVPTKATFVRRADHVCTEARGLSQRANAAVQKAFAAKDPAAAADAIDRYLPIFIAHVQSIKDLRRPKGEQKVLTGLLKVMDGQIRALTGESKALRDGDDALLQQIGAAQMQALTFAEELGKQYGFKVCGRAA